MTDNNIYVGSNYDRNSLMHAKYIKKIMGKNGKYRYIYDTKELKAMRDNTLSLRDSKNVNTTRTTGGQTKRTVTFSHISQGQAHYYNTANGKQYIARLKDKNGSHASKGVARRKDANGNYMKAPGGKTGTTAGKKERDQAAQKAKEKKDKALAIIKEARKKELLAKAAKRAKKEERQAKIDSTKKRITNTVAEKTGYAQYKRTLRSAESMKRANKINDLGHMAGLSADQRNANKRYANAAYSKHAKDVKAYRKTAMGRLHTAKENVEGAAWVVSDKAGALKKKAKSYLNNKSGSDNRTIESAKDSKRILNSKIHEIKAKKNAAVNKASRKIGIAQRQELKIAENNRQSMRTFVDDNGKYRAKDARNRTITVKNADGSRSEKMYKATSLRKANQNVYRAQRQYNKTALGKAENTVNSAAKAAKDTATAVSEKVKRKKKKS